MKPLAAVFSCRIALVAIFAAGPLAAQQSDDSPGLMERGMEMFLEGLRDEMSPALENMRKLSDEYGPAMFSFLEEMGPAFGEMLDQVKDWTAYRPPEILPNGDIILRKKVPSDTVPDPDPEVAPQVKTDPPTGQIDL